MRRGWWFWFQLLLTLLHKHKERPMPVPPGGKALIDGIKGEDVLVTADTAKLTADQADDAAAHSGLAAFMTTNSVPVLGYLSADALSVEEWTLNPDGKTFTVVNIPLAS
jgi:hypothetical protein